jgi:hypothetical protein
MSCIHETDFALYESYATWIQQLLQRNSGGSDVRLIKSDADSVERISVDQSYLELVRDCQFIEFSCGAKGTPQTCESTTDDNYLFFAHCATPDC